MSRAGHHRPWPLPRMPWVLAMTWVDLLFMHWPVPVAALRPHVPAALELDTFDGAAWVGVVPFKMTSTRPRLLPPTPGLSTFPELNVRTYVSVGGKPGVWFFSLDAFNRPAVEAARLTWRLPYFYAAMTCTRRDDGGVDYRSERRDRRAPAASFDARYGPTGDARQAAPGSLDAFLTDRFCLYTADRRGRPWRGEIDHAPWPLQPAACDTRALDMTRLIGVDLPDTPPLLHFARRLDVHAWLPYPATRRTP